MEKMISVAVYEDNTKLRELLDLLINSTPGLRTLGLHSNCENVRLDVIERRPDVVIMDIDMPMCDGVEGVKRVKETDASVKVIMHTVFDDDDRLFACLSNGADGYLLKRDSSARLIQAIHDVLSGDAPMSPGIASRVLKSFQRSTPPNDAYHITKREQQILELLAKGYSYRMIGVEFEISPETVKRHLKNIYQKLHVQCGPEAVAKAIRARIIE